MTRAFFSSSFLQSIFVAGFVSQLPLRDCFAEQVQISNMNDISFGSWSGSLSMEQTDAVCIYNDSANTNYKISATSPGGVFRMTNGGNNLNFEVRFQGSSGGFVQLTHGSPSNFTAANISSSNCSGGTNATLKVTVTESDLAAAKAGTYSGSLSLLLEPN